MNPIGISTYLELLEFALGKSDMGDRKYLICHEGEDSEADDVLCLIIRANAYSVHYIERGKVMDRADFEALVDAANHFFWRLTRPVVPMNFASQWENETGKKLFQ